MPGKSRENKHGAMTPEGSILGLMSPPVVLGDVVVELVGPLLVLPTQPNEDATLNWPTSKIAMNKLVWMENGTQWKVYRPPNILRDGRIQVPLRSPDKRSMTAFIVGVADLDTPIWNVGEPVPVPVDPGPPVVVPDPPVPTDPPPNGTVENVVETVVDVARGVATGRPITPPGAKSSR